MENSPAHANQDLPERSFIEYQHDELDDAFMQIANRSNWKGPIDAYVRSNKKNRDLEIILASILYFTATPPTVEWDEGRGAWHITAIGYGAGPAGP